MMTVTLERHAARTVDPESSKAAVVRYAKGWDSMNGRALRAHWEAEQESPGYGLTNFEAEQRAKLMGGMGKSPWKRVSELHTAYNPPLIDNVRDDAGQKVMRAGEFETEVEVFAITEAGKQRYRSLRNA